MTTTIPTPEQWASEVDGRKRCAVCRLPEDVLAQVDKSLDDGMAADMVARWVRNFYPQLGFQGQTLRRHRREHASA
jgi:hypothetical protein